jgi:hypothetical protein
MPGGALLERTSFAAQTRSTPEMVEEEGFGHLNRPTAFLKALSFSPIRHTYPLPEEVRRKGEGRFHP